MSYGLRTDTRDMPWKSGGVTLLHLAPDGTITQDHTTTGKRAMVREPVEGRILAVWTGQWHSDVFDVAGEGLEAARAALG